MLPSESTLRSAAPSVGADDVARITEQAMVLAGGTLLELHPTRMGQADVVLRGSQIVQVGGKIADDLPRVDVSDCIVTPAFTIGHTHLYMALTCGMPPPASTPRTLTDHLQWIWWPLDKALDDDLVHASALVGAAMAAKAGAASIVDLHSSPRAIDGALDRIEAALDEVGVRGVLAYETSDREGRARRDAALRENRRFLKKVRSGETHHRALVGAHAMMSLNDDTLDALRDVAEEFGVGLHLHVAEDTTDALDAQRNKRTSLEQRLERLGIARPNSVIAQAVELAPDVVRDLGRAGAFVATSPRSNMRHGVGLFGGSGDHVVLGTDGLDGDILAEARAYALRHDEAKDGLAREAGARIAAGQAMVGRLFGDPAPPRIAAGARADLAILDYHSLTPMNQSNVIEHVVRGWSATGVRHTIVGGRFVVRDRALVNVDERALVGRSRPAASRLWERMQGYY
ncbi:MAG: amidohydrolase family protein [Labilithrix sp.]|nr:amidohydrolase family protein [Labilithrix sp.]MBX3219698.1 amidohydrolase family protein [Labilithrix sp.]